MVVHRWAARCGFGTFLDNAIINQLIRGVGDESLILKLTKSDTATKAEVIAQIQTWDLTKQEVPLYGYLQVSSYPVASSVFATTGPASVPGRSWPGGSSPAGSFS